MILLILSGFIGAASALDTSKLQWSGGIQYTLKSGEVATYNGYTVQVITFPPPVESNKYSDTPSEPVNPYVGLNISKNGSFLNTTVLGTNESYITPDGELKVTVIELPSPSAKEWLFENYHPWATIELAPKGTPNLVVSVDTDKTDYTSSEDSEIIATVTLENTGSADLVNVDVGIQADLSVKRGNLKYHYETIKAGEQPIVETITFISPMPTEKKMYNISANISGYDALDVPYKVTSLKTISIAVDPEWSMSLQKTTQEKIYLKDTAMVTLSLKNKGKYDVNNVSIRDYLPPGFKLVSNTSLHWVANIQAGGEWENRYLIAPEEPDSNGAVFPVATAEFKVRNELYGIRSNQPKMIVYGPKIELNKQTDVSDISPGDSVTVTVTAKNTGSTPTRVVIRDHLPENATVISGVTAYEDFLEAGKDVSYSYVIKIDFNQSVELPPATAEYYKLGTSGGTIRTQSQGIEIKIKSPDTVSPDTPTNQITPPQVTETPAIPEPNNSANPNNTNGSNEPSGESGSNISKSSGPNDEADAILKFILGCENDSSIANNNLNDSASNACSYFRQNQ